MHERELETTIRRAIDAGLLPASAAVPAAESQPWSILILSAAGAALLIIPLLGLLFYFFIEGAHNGEVQLACALLGLAVAIPVARSFSEFSLGDLFAGTVILVSLTMLGFAAVPLLHERGATVGVAVMATILCFVVTSAWLRMTLGGIACAATFVAFFTFLEAYHPFTIGNEAPLYLLTLFWCGLHGVQTLLLEERRAASAAATLESFCSGWIYVLLVLNLALWGRPFSSFAVEDFSLTPGGAASSIISATFALVAGAWLACRWTSLRRPWYAPVVLLVQMLAWWLPMLGPMLWVAAYCGTSGRASTATAAGVAALWIVGVFCYGLPLPLTSKAAMLAGAGLALGLAALMARAQSDHERGEKQTAAPRHLGRFARAKLGMALSTGLTLLAVNIGIVKNERTFAQEPAGRLESRSPIPRSTAPGDFAASRSQLEERHSPDGEQPGAGKRDMRSR